MVFRTGILVVPEHDDEALAAVLHLLRSHLPTLLLLQTLAIDNQRNWIEETLRRWCDEEELDLILTIGGTNPAPGPSGEEIVPKATAALLERPLPGLSEAMRAYAADQSLLAWLDCGVAGVRGRSLLINLPAGATPALLFLNAIVELIEPLLLHLHDPEKAPNLADDLERIEVGDDHAEDDGYTLQTSSPASMKQSTGGLNPEEFAAFLQRPRTSST